MIRFTAHLTRGAHKAATVLPATGLAVTLLGCPLPASAQFDFFGLFGGRSEAQDQSRETSFEVLLDEAYSGIERPQTQVIRDQATWERYQRLLFAGVQPRPELPPVDFEQDMLVLIAAGAKTSGGYDIAVEEVRTRGSELIIRIRERCPPAGAMTTMALTQPVQVVRMPRSTQRPVFQRELGRNCP